MLNKKGKRSKNKIVSTGSLFDRFCNLKKNQIGSKSLQYRHTRKKSKYSKLYSIFGGRIYSLDHLGSSFFVNNPLQTIQQIGSEGNMIWIKWLNTKNVCQTYIYIWHMSTHVKLITTNARSVSEYFQSYLDQSKYGCQELDNLFRYVIQNPSKIA